MAPGSWPPPENTPLPSGVTPSSGKTALNSIVTKPTLTSGAAGSLFHVHIHEVIQFNKHKFRHEINDCLTIHFIQFFEYPWRHAPVTFEHYNHFRSIQARRSKCVSERPAM
ncbi:hypothetical protein IV454_18725 [Massilia antarctica]|uniref:Uncharacterized protein n=1 Tax=Massilia antarctica TaxID=2765360 RepID=A0AA48W9J7_9BURK|nr:hypothetical protein [Massilia antarctica]QPI47623.1 hypothetical protein IV454_18725 [Massilia antarctica]